MTVVLQLGSGHYRVTDSLATVTAALNGATKFFTVTLAAEGPLGGSAMLVNRDEVLSAIDTTATKRSIGEAAG